MALAGALRSDQRHGARRPIGPVVDQRERGLVAGAAEKIRALEAFPMTERKIELARQSRIAHDGTLPGALALLGARASRPHCPARSRGRGWEAECGRDARAPRKGGGPVTPMNLRPKHSYVAPTRAYRIRSRRASKPQQLT